MKRDNIYIYALFAVIAMIFCRCSNFDDLNTNPDTTTEVSASMLCTNVVLTIAEFKDEDLNFIRRSVVSKYLASANDMQVIEQFNKFSNASFNNLTVLPSIDKMVEYASENQTETVANSYKGVAKFARAYLFYYLTMQVGDIPYGEAGKGMTGVYKPTYDAQEAVFYGILNELEEADQYFAQGNKFEGDPTPYDGDPNKWRRAVNSFELKVLMSLSPKSNSDSLNVKNRFQKVVNEGYLLDESTGFWGLKYSSKDLYPLSSTSDMFTSRAILSSLFVDMLKKYNDRRLFYYAKPAAKKVSDGLAEKDTAAYNGIDLSVSSDEMDQHYLAGEYSAINARYLEENACEPRMLITYAEQELILAEAKIKGWITNGSAKNYYENGVKSALTNVMNYMNANYAHGMPVNQSYIDNYFADEAVFKSTTEEQLKQIWSQRYILNFFQDDLGSYFEYRRTGFPEFPVNTQSSLNPDDKSAIPMRWLYPSSEALYNNANLSVALHRQFKDGYDGMNQVMWLLK